MGRDPEQIKRRNYRIMAVAFLVLIVVNIISPGQQNETNKDETNREQQMGLFSKAPKAGDQDIPAGNHIKIETEKGEVLIELYPDSAPNTVANFKALVGKGYYDGLIFHRVIAGFMAQGGDPKGTGTGGPGYKVKAEFNDVKHERGILSMARASDPDSAGSQFFICFDAHPHLDRQYTVFGKVTEGMDVVDNIVVGTGISKVSILP